MLKEIRPHGQLDVLAELLSVVDVISSTGLSWENFRRTLPKSHCGLMDHLMNNRLSLEFGQTYARIPLEKSPHIWHGDALETDWNDLLPSGECSYVLGNPPFVGAKFQSPAQREQVRHIAALGRSGGTLDYVAAWFIKAGEYVQQGAAQIGFVATNSITQANKWRNSGRFYLTVTSWTSPSRTAPLPGDRTLAAWRVFTSSLSD